MNKRFLLSVAIAFALLPASQTMATEFGVSASTYLGDISSDECIYGAAYLSDGTLVLALNLGPINPGGVTPLYLNGATDNSSGGIMRLSGDGTTVLSFTRIGTGVYDLSVDSNDNLLVAAGSDGLLKLNATATSILASALSGEFVYRADMAQDGHCVALVPDNLSDPDQKAGNGTVYVFDSSLTELNSFSGGYAQTLDVAIDSASETVFTIGFTNKFTWGGTAYGPSTPVDVPGLRGVPYDYDPGNGINARWSGYNWDANVWLDEAKTIPNPRYINYPFSTDPSNLTENRYPLVDSSNMADSRGYRVEVAADGNLYAAFEFDGGNTPFRWSPFDLTASQSPVGGDIFHQTFNTSTVPKVFFGRYVPATGELLLSQWYTNRLYNQFGPANDNTIRMKGGALWADEAGRVYIGGSSASGMPIPGNSVYSASEGEITFNPFDPSVYTGGGYLMVYSSDLTTRLFTTRLSASGSIKTIAARTINGESDASIAWAGTASLGSPLFTANAIQQKPGYGASDATLGVLGGVLFDGSEGFTFDLNFSTPYIPSGSQKLRDSNESNTILDLDGDSLADDSRSGYALILPTGDNPTETPLSPTVNYSGPAFFGGFYSDRLNTTSNSLADNIVSSSQVTIRAQPPSGYLAQVHGVFFVPKSEFPGINPGDALDFSAGDKLKVNVPTLGAEAELRLIVRNGESYYVSEDAFPGGGEIGFIQDIEDGRWANWDIPESMDFDPDSAQFNDQNFSDITGVGFVVDSVSYNGGRFFMKWNGFVAEMRRNGIDNQPPVPLFTISQQRGQLPLAVMLDSSPSYDTDGTVDFVTWNFGDGGSLGGPAVDHTYLAAGEFYPTLTIYDNLLSQQQLTLPVVSVLGLVGPTEKIFASFGGSTGSKAFGRRTVNTVDLDGDLSSDDYRISYSFSDTLPITEDSLRGTELFGGLIGESIDGQANMAEGGISSNQVSIRLQSSGAEGGARIRGLFYIDKTGFLGNAKSEAVSFENGSSIAVRTESHWDALGTTYWVVRDGTAFYLSETPITLGSNQTAVLNFTSSTDHGRWTAFDPSADPGMDFDQGSAVYQTRQFTDVTGVGLFFEKDNYTTDRSWANISAIEATGLVGSGLQLTASYEDWLALNFTSAELADTELESTLWGQDADPDVDGENKLEILLMGNPKVYDLPNLVDFYYDSGDVVLEFSIRKSIGGVDWDAAFHIEESLTLQPDEWQTVFDSSLCNLSQPCSQGDTDYAVLQSFSDHYRVSVRLPVSDSRKFLRILVP